MNEMCPNCHSIEIIPKEDVNTTTKLWICTKCNWQFNNPSYKILTQPILDSEVKEANRVTPPTAEEIVKLVMGSEIDGNVIVKCEITDKCVWVETNLGDGYDLVRCYNGKIQIEYEIDINIAKYITTFFINEGEIK